MLLKKKNRMSLSCFVIGYIWRKVRAIMVEFEKVVSTDLERLQSLATQIWNESYRSMISQQQIDYMLDLMYNSEKLKLELELQYSWYFIVYEYKKIGFLCFYEKQSELFLSKLYIEKQHQGKGFASKALGFMEQQAVSQGYTSMYLTVNKGNTNAIKSYQKFGFEIERSEIFEIGNGFVMDDYIMRKNL